MATRSVPWMALGTSRMGTPQFRPEESYKSRRKEWGACRLLFRWFFNAESTEFIHVPSISKDYAMTNRMLFAAPTVPHSSENREMHRIVGFSFTCLSLPLFYLSISQLNSGWLNCFCVISPILQRQTAIDWLVFARATCPLIWSSGYVLCDEPQQISFPQGNLKIAGTLQSQINDMFYCCWRHIQSIWNPGLTN